MPWPGRRSARSGQRQRPHNEQDRWRHRAQARRPARGGLARGLHAGRAHSRKWNSACRWRSRRSALRRSRTGSSRPGTLRAPEVVTLTVLDNGVLEINRGSGGRRLAEGDTVKAGDEIARIVGEDVRIAARLNAAQRAYDAALDRARGDSRDFRARTHPQVDARQRREQIRDREARRRALAPHRGSQSHDHADRRRDSEARPRHGWTAARERPARERGPARRADRTARCA